MCVIVCVLRYLNPENIKQKSKRTSYVLADFMPMIDLDEIYVQDTLTYVGLYNIISKLTSG